MSEYVIDILGTAALRKCSELQLEIKELEAKLKEAINGTLLKRYNEEKEDALEKLKIAVEALELIGGKMEYYCAVGDQIKQRAAQEALKKVKEV
jgi:hypothetical protein